MRIIAPRQYIEAVFYRREFRWSWGSPGHGFSFDCDAQGNVKLTNAAAALNYYMCLSGAHDVVDEGIGMYESGYTAPARGLCDCGEEVTLSGFTNPCDCGRDYDSNGGLLAPRSQWGEETGESLGEILSI